MALIRIIHRSDKDRSSVHRETRCLYTIVEATNNSQLVQLDTFGSDDREFTEKVSQSVQFDRTSAEQLIAIFKEAFPGI